MAKARNMSTEPTTIIEVTIALYQRAIDLAHFSFRRPDGSICQSHPRAVEARKHLLRALANLEKTT